MSETGANEPCGAAEVERRKEDKTKESGTFAADPSLQLMSVSPQASESLISE